MVPSLLPKLAGFCFMTLRMSARCWNQPSQKTDLASTQEDELYQALERFFHADVRGPADDLSPHQLVYGIVSGLEPKQISESFYNRTRRDDAVIADRFGEYICPLHKTTSGVGIYPVCPRFKYVFRQPCYLYQF